MEHILQKLWNKQASEQKKQDHSLVLLSEDKNKCSFSYSRYNLEQERVLGKISEFSCSL